MKKYLTPFRIFIIVSIVVLAAVLFIPFRIQYTHDTFGKIMPLRQWLLVRGSDGTLITATRNNLQGLNDAYFVNQFERESAVNVSIRQGLSAGSIVQEGDTICRIYSSSSFEHYTSLQGQVKVAEADLKVYTSGDKQSIIELQKQQLLYAESEAEKKEKIVERLKKLYEKKLASEEEYQLAADELRSLKVNVDIARSALASVQEGAKPAEVERMKANLDMLKSELAAAQKQMHALNITAPFSGRIDRNFATDTLLIMSEANRYLAFLPVEYSQLSYFDKDTPVILKIGDKEIPAVILNIDYSIQILNEKQCVTVVVVFEDENFESYTGMIAPAELKGKMLSLFQYLNILINS